MLINLIVNRAGGIIDSVGYVLKLFPFISGQLPNYKKALDNVAFNKQDGNDLIFIDSVLMWQPSFRCCIRDMVAVFKDVRAYPYYNSEL